MHNIAQKRNHRFEILSRAILSYSDPLYHLMSLIDIFGLLVGIIKNQRLFEEFIGLRFLRREYSLKRHVLIYK